MKYKVIKLEGNKSVLVDESAEIKEGDWFFNEDFKDIGNSISLVEWSSKYNKKIFKIVATINHSISLDVPMVIVEDEIGKLADEYSKSFIDADGTEEVDFIAGYEAAQQKGVYSEEDLRKGISTGLSVGYFSAFNIDNKSKEVDNIIQSLNQESIELEVEQLNNKPGSSYSTETIYKLETTSLMSVEGTFLSGCNQSILMEQLIKRQLVYHAMNK
jgi:hypothetical protein